LTPAPPPFYLFFIFPQLGQLDNCIFRSSVGLWGFRHGSSHPRNLCKLSFFAFSLWRTDSPAKSCARFSLLSSPCVWNINSCLHPPKLLCPTSNSQADRRLLRPFFRTPSGIRHHVLFVGVSVSSRLSYTRPPFPFLRSRIAPCSMENHTPFVHCFFFLRHVWITSSTRSQGLVFQALEVAVISPPPTLFLG